MTTEPFTLDVEEQEAVSRILAEIQRRGYDLSYPQQRLAVRLSEAYLARKGQDSSM